MPIHDPTSDDDDPEDLKEGRRLRREREKQLFEQGMRAGSNVRGGVKWGPVMLRAPTNEADVSVASKSNAGGGLAFG